MIRDLEALERQGALQVHRKASSPDQGREPYTFRSSGEIGGVPSPENAFAGRLTGAMPAKVGLLYSVSK